MADFPVTGNYYVWPTYGTAQAGVGAVARKGSELSELAFTRLFAALQGSAYVFTGLTVPASSSDLTLAVALGDALIDGRYVSIPGATTVTCVASNTNYIYLRLVLDANGYVTDAEFEVNITGTAPANSLLIASATAGGSTISATRDRRPTTLRKGRRNRLQVYETAGSTPWVTPNVDGADVILAGAGGGGGDGESTIDASPKRSGGGGGAGAFQIGWVALTPGNLETVVCGLGGPTHWGNSRLGVPLNGTAGTASSFAGLSANGGAGGAKFVGSPAGPGAGGAGGAATLSSATIGIAGQAGADGDGSGNGGKGGVPGGFYFPGGIPTGGVTGPNIDDGLGPNASAYVPYGGGGGGAGEETNVLIAGISKGGGGADGLVVLHY